MNDHAHDLAEAEDELGELGEVWLERHLVGHDNGQVAVAINQATKDYRRAERKLRRA